MLCLPLELQKAIVAELSLQDVVGEKRRLVLYCMREMTFLTAAIARTYQGLFQMVLRVGIGALNMNRAPDCLTWPALSRTQSGEALLRTARFVLLRAAVDWQTSSISPEQALCIGGCPEVSSIEMAPRIFRTNFGSMQGCHLQFLNLASVVLHPGWERILEESRMTLLDLYLENVTFPSAEPLHIPTLTALQSIEFYYSSEDDRDVAASGAERALCAAATSRLTQLWLYGYKTAVHAELLSRVGAHLETLRVDRYTSAIATSAPRLKRLHLDGEVPSSARLPADLEELGAPLLDCLEWCEFLARGGCTKLKIFHGDDDEIWMQSTTLWDLENLRMCHSLLVKRGIIFLDPAGATIDAEWLRRARARIAAAEESQASDEDDD